MFTYKATEATVTGDMHPKRRPGVLSFEKT